MKIYGDTISPFVRMCLVTAHECGLSGKLEHVKEAVKPTLANPKCCAMMNSCALLVIDSSTRELTW